MNHIQLFHTISSLYGLFFHYQYRIYKDLLDRFAAQLQLNHPSTVLDVGCGTGALCNVLHDQGMKVTGIDPARGMIQISKQKSKNKAISLLEADVLKGLPFADHSFDVVITSFVAHGLKLHQRQQMLLEIKRVARSKIIMYDYNDQRGLLTDMIEWVEHGDYFNFVNSIQDELHELFDQVEIVQVNQRTAFYIMSLT